MMRRQRGATGDPSATVQRSDEPLLLGEPGTAYQALDQVQANIFVADPQLNIVYANSRARKTLGSIGGEIQRAFNIRLDAVVGGSIHRFHKDPAKVERILRGGSTYLPHETEFTFGSVTLEARINQITRPDGSLAGYVVAWEEISQRMAAEARARALVERFHEIQEVSAAVQTVAGATEEMAASVKEIARNATEATETVSAATSVVDSASRTMAELGQASTEISDIVKTIGTVAEQTNLLALNATIEAARAGDSGKGFAVVAGEVKELSKQTKGATERINSMIAEVQRLSAAAIEAIDNISEVVSRVSQNQESIASAVEQQNATTNEISRSLADAARRAEDIASFTAANR